MMENSQTVEALAQEWLDMEVHSVRLARDKKDLIERMEAEVSNAPTTGTRSLSGVDKKISITFRRNNSYPDKEKLQDLLLDSGLFTPHMFDELFGYTIKEKPAAVDKFLLEIRTPAAEKLARMRVSRPGTPTVKVTSNK